MAANLYKTDLIRELARRHHRSQAHYHTALREVLSGITTALQHGQRVQLTGFGTFYSRLQPAAKIRDIRTRKTITLPVRYVVAFHVGELLKHSVLRTKRTLPSEPRRTKGHTLPRLPRLFHRGSK